MDVLTRKPFTWEEKLNTLMAGESLNLEYSLNLGLFSQGASRTPLPIPTPIF